MFDRDRAPLRHAQPPAQRRASIAAGAGAPSRALELDRRASACSTSAPARPTWRSRPLTRPGLARATWSGSTSPARCCASALEKVRRGGARAAYPPRARRCDAVCRCRRCHVRRGDGRLRHPQRRRPGGGVPRILRVLRPGGRLAILEFGFPRFPASTPPIVRIFSTCCRASDAWSRSTRTPIRICRRRSRNSRPLTPLRAFCGSRGSPGSNSGRSRPGSSTCILR